MAPLLRRLGWSGRLGRATGEGFFTYEDVVMRAVTFQAPMEVRVDERPGAGAREPATTPSSPSRPAASAALTCTSTTAGSRCEPGFTIGHEFVGRVLAAGDAVTRVAVGRPRVRLLSHRLRHVLLLHARRLSEVRPGPGVRPRRGAGRAAGHPGRPGAGADGQPHAAPGARRGVRRRRAVRRRRDGHRLPRRRVGRRASRETAWPCSASGRSACARSRSRSPPAPAPVLAIDSVEARLEVARGFGAVPVHLTEDKPRDVVRTLDRGPRRRRRHRRGRPSRRARPRHPPGAQRRHRRRHRRLRRAVPGAHGRRLDQGA